MRPSAQTAIRFADTAETEVFRPRWRWAVGSDRSGCRPVVGGVVRELPVPAARRAGQGGETPPSRHAESPGSTVRVHDQKSTSRHGLSPFTSPSAFL